MTQERSAAEQLFAGKGEMAMRMRNSFGVAPLTLDWSQTPLGSVETLPQSLRSALSICLNSRFPIAVYWGQDCLLLYNDAWRPIVGDKHPWALGRPAREVWSEIWDDIGPELASVLATGEGTFHKDELLSMHRFGYTEECFFEYTFNPIQGEGGSIDGVFNIVTETTYRVLNDRRARLLRAVASGAGTAKTAQSTCALMAQTLRSDPADIPLALLYLMDRDGKALRLCGSTEVDLDRSIAPEVVDLAADDPHSWSIASVAQTARSQIVRDLEMRFGALPGSPWSEPPQEAMILPISATGQGKVAGVLVAVASPRRRLDDNYLEFFNQVARQIGMAIANARSYEEERRRAEQLAELDRAKTVFFSNVSHEFRTPLTLMLAPLEDAIASLSDTIPAQEREQLQLVQRNGLRLLKLVNTLLDFSRIEAGRVEATYEPTDLAAFTAELASVFRSAIERANLRLVVNCPPLPEAVYVDREMWEKIVLNLLSNAFKFTFKGEISLDLQWQSDRVQLAVRDTGIGIPAAELPHLFERFHRVKGAQGRSIEGSGIGLSLVQELVKLHQGAIEVTSVEGSGTCFTISIPTGTAHLPQDRIGASRTLASTALGTNSYLEEALRWLPEDRGDKGEVGENASLSSLSPLSFLSPTSPARILLADDNTDMRDYVRRLLGQQYEVEAVSDGLAALSAVRQQVPDLILTDVMMPNLDGFGLLRSLRSDPQTREVPIIMLSARAGEESRIEGLAAGADDYLIKPFSARELLARVEASLKLARLRQEAGAALRESEEKYRTLFESIDQGFCIIEMIFDAANRPIDYRFSIVNPAFDKQTGTEKAQGKTVREIAPQHEDYWFEIYGNVALTGESIRFENHAQEFHRWYEVHAFRVGEPELRRVGILFNDISDRKSAEAEREQLLQREQAAREAAEQANRIKDEFLAVLSHELRSPLNPILGWSKLLKTGNLDAAKTAHALATIERNAKLQSELIEDLLDVSRILQGKLSLNVSPIDLGSIVKAAIETVRLAAEAKSIDLRFTLVDFGLDDVGVSPKSTDSDEQLGNLKPKIRLRKLGGTETDTAHFPQNPKFQVLGDATRLQQVVWNLLSNAVKFTPTGGQITVRLEQVDDKAHLVVSDTGKGIHPDFLPYVFDYFRQADGSTTRKFGGLGLGLAIVRHLVELHGGTVKAASPGEGLGATFTVKLPLIPIQPTINRDGASSEASLNLSGVHVLVIDDEMDSLEFVAFVLEQAGAIVTTATTAGEGFLALTQSQPDVLLSDIGMPDLDGYMLMRQVRALPPEQGGQILAIALTAYAGEYDRDLALRAGFQQHLAKPIEPNELIGAIATLFGRMKGRDSGI
ncbi:ATP-binding protein [Scytonema millei]|uniref:histidine kinase n=1 Tax=Scytonema millei VB511283 TaxID=1245923 RepID=A0A9X5I4U4_9CYAN|nr:ATP-binding protein [Scytonema millei]NHC35325.1 response regulator [Scytonema millei VB511283]